MLFLFLQDKYMLDRHASNEKEQVYHKFGSFSVLFYL